MVYLIFFFLTYKVVREGWPITHLSKTSCGLIRTFQGCFVSNNLTFIPRGYQNIDSWLIVAKLKRDK